MKKHLPLILSLSFILLAVTACSAAPGDSSASSVEPSAPPTPTESSVSSAECLFLDPELGAALTLPEQYIDSGALLPVIDANGTGMEIHYCSAASNALWDEMNMENKPELKEEEYMKELHRLAPVMLRVERFTEKQVTDVKGENPLQILTGSANATEAGRQDGYVYAVFEPEFDPSALEGESLELYNTLRKEMSAVRRGVMLIPIVEPEQEVPIGDALPAFSATDLDGNPVTNDILKGKKVTMINFWGTFCGPCISEMPDLGELARDISEGSQLLGVVVDGGSDENRQMAKDILTKANAGFMNIVPDDALLNYTKAMTGVPTTIFVDENGKLLGKPIVGARFVGEYESALEEYLE